MGERREDGAPRRGAVDSSRRCCISARCDARKVREEFSVGLGQQLGRTGWNGYGFVQF